MSTNQNCTGLDEPDLARLRNIAISEAVDRALLDSWAAARERGMTTIHPADSELPDDIRIPLHRISADIEYLIGRAHQGETNLAIRTVKALCDDVERSVRAALGDDCAMLYLLRKQWDKAAAEQGHTAQAEQPSAAALTPPMRQGVSAV